MILELIRLLKIDLEYYIFSIPTQYSIRFIGKQFFLGRQKHYSYIIIMIIQTIHSSKIFFKKSNKSSKLVLRIIKLRH